MYDLITMGRCGVDIYPLQVGVGLEDVETFGKFLGGSPANVAVAGARLGLRSALISTTGDDPFGRFVRRALTGFGVDDRYVTVTGEAPTPVTFCEIFPPDTFPIYFYRGELPPDLRITPEGLDRRAIRDARIFWVTTTGLCRQPSRDTHHALLADRDGDTVLDLDYRPVFWPSIEAARAAVQEILPHIDVVVGNRDEVEMASGARDPDEAAEAFLAEGITMAVVKLGPEGVLARTKDERVVVPPVQVEVVNGLGAGDAFGGALCQGLIEGRPLERAVRYANAAGAIVASRLACSSAMPTPAEISVVMRKGTTDG